jgi:DNA-binding protein HU-beta
MQRACASPLARAGTVVARGVLDCDARAAYNRTRFSSRFSPRGGRMNKHELIAKVAKDINGSKNIAALAVESVIEGITRALKKGDSVTFVGFGTFKTANRKARTARNPQTGAMIKIPKRKAVRFVAGKALKSAVN